MRDAATLETAQPLRTYDEDPHEQPKVYFYDNQPTRPWYKRGGLLAILRQDDEETYP